MPNKSIELTRGILVLLKLVVMRRDVALLKVSGIPRSTHAKRYV